MSFNAAIFWGSSSEVLNAIASADAPSIRSGNVRSASAFSRTSFFAPDAAASAISPGA